MTRAKTKSKDSFMQALAKPEELEVCPWQSITFIDYQVDGRVKVDMLLHRPEVDWVVVYNQLVRGSWTVSKKEYARRVKTKLHKTIDPRNKALKYGWVATVFTLWNRVQILVARKDNGDGTWSISCAFVYEWH